MCYCTLLQYSCFRVSTLSDPEARSVTCTWSEMIYVRSECCLMTDRTWSIYIYLHNPGDDDESLMVRPIHDLIGLGLFLVQTLLLHQAPIRVENRFWTICVLACIIMSSCLLLCIFNGTILLAHSNFHLIFLPSPEKSFQPLALTMAPVAALAVWIN